MLYKRRTCVRGRGDYKTLNRLISNLKRISIFIYPQPRFGHLGFILGFISRSMRYFVQLRQRKAVQKEKMNVAGKARVAWKIFMHQMFAASYGQDEAHLLYD